MSDHTVYDYEGPRLRRLVAECRPDLADGSRPPVWVFWRRARVKFPAEAMVLLSSEWGEADTEEVRQDLRACREMGPRARADQLRPGLEETMAQSLAPHRLGQEDLGRRDPTESLWEASMQLGRERVRHTTGATWSRRKRDADQATVHLLRSEHDVVAVVDLGQGAEAVATSGVCGVDDGGPRAVVLSARRGRVLARRGDGVDWPVRGRTPVVPDEEMAVRWWLVPGLNVDRSAMPGPVGEPDAGMIRAQRPDDRLL